MTILLRGDIKQRTFRDVIPFRPGDDTSKFPTAMARRKGFFSISENDPNNNNDDVLHLTINVNQPDITNGSPQLLLSGKAAMLRRPVAAGGPKDTDIDTALERNNYFFGSPATNTQPAQPSNLNQPESDDGQTTINNTGSSPYAEVCWFLRNGVLYRRMLLIRSPYVNPVGTSNQPQDASQNDFVPGNYSTFNLPPNPDFNGITWQDAVGRFWYDFDYSAYNDWKGNGLLFHDAQIRFPMRPGAENPRWCPIRSRWKQVWGFPVCGSVTRCDARPMRRTWPCLPASF